MTYEEDSVQSLPEFYDEVGNAEMSGFGGSDLRSSEVVGESGELGFLEEWVSSELNCGVAKCGQVEFWN